MELETVYEENVYKRPFCAFAIDVFENVLVLMKKPYQGKSIPLLIIDLNDQQVLLKENINDTSLMGRIKTQNFVFMGGYLYSQNNCIKIRYDLLRKNMIKDFRE